MSLLCQSRRLREIWVGSDFALGYRREGDVARLAEIGRVLGHHVSGIAKRGGPRDRELRFAAARMTVPDGFAVPASGFYATRVRSGDRQWSATVNMEPNSTGTERGRKYWCRTFPIMAEGGVRSSTAA
jgi:FAD synthase